MKVDELKKINTRKLLIKSHMKIINQERTLMMSFSFDHPFDEKIRNRIKQSCIMENQIIQKEQAAIDEMMNKVNSMKPEYQELLDMYYIKGIPHKVCAEIKGISVSNFYKHLKKAIEEFESR